MAQIEKVRIPVEVSVAGREPEGGCFFLLPWAELRLGPETLLDLLNGPSRVLPLARDSDGRTVLVFKERIQYLAAPLDVPREYLMPPSFRSTRRERVRVAFESGVEAVGTLEMELDYELTRASDYMNDSEDFFPLIDAARVLLINKRRLTEIELLEAQVAGDGKIVALKEEGGARLGASRDNGSGESRRRASGE